MSAITTAVRQPVTVTVGVILVVLAGLLALQRIPIQLTPNVEDTIVAVTTFWEGASPQEIEQDIVDEQEEKLQGIANLKNMTSTSQQGQGVIRLEFAVGTSKEEALREVSDKLREVPEYPDGADEPVIEASDPENQDFIAWMLLQTDDPELDIRTLNDFAEDRIKPTLERVGGISEVNVLGGREREVQIRFDPRQLAQRGLSPADLAAAVRRTNRNVSAGRLEQDKSDWRLRLVSQYDRIEEVERTVLAETPGGPVLLRDVAEVVSSYKEPTSFVRSKGRPAIAINAQKEVGANVMEVMAGLRAALEHLNAPGGVLEVEAARLGLDGGLRVRQVYDQTVYIDDALSLVQDNIWLGGSIAIVVLLLFLRSLRSAAIIALAIPISVIGAVAAMVAMGRTVNVISLAGMAFAVGMVVDNAIVVLENVFRHLEMGKTRLRAALDGAQEVAGAVVAATLTTVVVFVPILLVQEEAGQLFRDIALAIVAAVSLSLVVSVSVIPSASARLLPRAHVRHARAAKKRRGPLARLGAAVGSLPRLLGRVIHALCGSTLARVGIVAALTFASIVGTQALMPPLDYLPQGNRNMVFGMLVAPPGYNIDQQEVLARRIESVVAPFYEAGSLEPGSEEYERAKAELPGIPTTTPTGQPGPDVVPPPIDNYFLVSFEGTMFHGAIAVEGERVVDYLSLYRVATNAERAPGMLAFAFQMPLFRLGGRTGSAVKVNLSGDDLDAVVRSSLAVYGDLVQRYGVYSVQPDPSNFNLPGLELQVEPDLVRLEEAGMSPEGLGVAVQALGDGALLGDYRIGGQTVDLKLLTQDPASGSRVEALRDAPIATPRGGVVPLSSLATIRRVNAAPQINRDNRQRSVTLQFTAPDGMPLEQALDEIEEVLDGARERGVIPATVATSTTGSASKLVAVQSAMLGDGTLTGTLTSSLVLALLVVYLLMCVLFQSFLHPLVIMFSVPLATLGGFAALSAVHEWSLVDPYMPVQKLDILTILGFVILIGVVVNNAILIVHQSLNFMRGEADAEGGSREPMAPREAIAEAVTTRVRPILMSTATSVGGMLPLVLMPGSGSELYRGLGAVVVGGLVVSTLFTLVLVPLLFSPVVDVQSKLGRAPGDARDAERSAAPRGAAATAGLVLAAALPLLAGCAQTTSREEPLSIEELVTRTLHEHMRSLDAVTDRAPADAFPETPVPDGLADEDGELEALGGPSAYGAVHPDLATDLLGRPREVSAIDLERAVVSSAAFNMGVELSRLEPDIAEEDVVIAEADFDTTLFSQGGWTSLDEPRSVTVINGVVLGRPRTRNTTSFVEAGVRQQLSTGATVGVSTFAERFNNRTRGIDFDPDPSWRSGVGVFAEVPLLRGAGRDVAEGDIDLSRNEVERSRQALRADLMTVVLATESAYWDLVEAWTRLHIQERLTEQGEEVEGVLRERAVFDVEPAQVSDALATVERRRADLVRDRRQVEAASDRLLLLMNDPELPPASERLLRPTDDLDAEPVPFRLEEALATALTERPELEAALLDIDDSRVRERIARDALQPLLDLSARVDVAGLDDGFSSSYQSTWQDDHDTFSVGLSFELPFGNRAAEAGERQARRLQEQAVVRYRDAAQTVVYEVKSALRDVEAQFALVGAARTTRLAETENLRALLLLEEQRNELTPEFLNLKFQRQERLAIAQRQEVAALADYNRAVAAYYRALGVGSRLGTIVLEGEDERAP